MIRCCGFSYRSFSTWTHQLNKLFNNSCFLSLYSAGKPTIYFVTAEGGLKSYSVETSETSTVVNTSEALIGVTYDFNRDLVYWSSFIPDNRTASRVYRKQRNGNQATTLLRTDECKLTFCSNSYLFLIAQFWFFAIYCRWDHFGNGFRLANWQHLFGHFWRPHFGLQRTNELITELCLHSFRPRFGLWNSCRSQSRVSFVFLKH